MKTDRAYVLQILESIRRIEENTSGGRDVFMISHTLQDAVLRNLHTMAESTQRLSVAARETQPAVDWRLLAAFRNVLVHDYLGVDLVQIWWVVQNNVPDLKSAAEAILSTLRPED
jgi:uncharacterized protein with HEPN domain